MQMRFHNDISINNHPAVFLKKTKRVEDYFLWCKRRQSRQPPHYRTCEKMNAGLFQDVVSCSTHHYFACFTNIPEAGDSDKCHHSQASRRKERYTAFARDKNVCWTSLTTKVSQNYSDFSPMPSHTSQFPQAGSPGKPKYSEINTRRQWLVR